MKKIVMGICSLVLILILVMAAYTMYGRSVRRTELDNALSSGMQKAMQMLNAEEYAPRSNEEFTALFLEAFFVSLESSSDVTVHILDADFEKGMLSAEAVLTYKHPIGTTGKVAAQRTIIREEYAKDGGEESFVIQYIADGELYKKYVLKKGTPLIVPAEPQNGAFLGWRKLEEDDVLLPESLLADRDYTFMAVFE